MTALKNLTYFSVVALFGMWGCSSNQFASRSGASYDDLYGSSSDVQVATRTNSNQRDSRYANPEYQESNPNANGQNADYYDESYLTSRNVQRRVSDDVGYNAGFREGYNVGQAAAFDPFFMNSMRFGSFGPMFGMGGSAFSMGFQMGLNRSMRFGFSPFASFGNGWGNSWGMPGMGFGYDPFFGGSMAYGGMYSPFGMGGMYSPFGMGGMYSPFGMGGMYNAWGSPFGMGGMYGYNPYYGGFGNRVYVVNNYDNGGTVNRSYGPRSSAARSNNTYNSDFSNSVRTSRNNSGGREGYSSGVNSPSRGSATTTDSYYARPRANSSGTYYSGNSNPARSSAEGNTSTGRSSSSNSNYEYYSTPRSSSNSSYGVGSNRSSRTYNNSGSTYNSNRGYNNNNSTYQTPNRSSESGSRTSAPTYSSPSRGSVSTPAPSSSGGGSSAPRSRGPR